ncbi:TPA: YSIRK-type signal peptide-containing protein, partial [Staphylococcus aureus]
MFIRKQKFSIRKYTMGTASVMLGVVFLFSNLNNVEAAEEQKVAEEQKAAEEQKVAEEQKAAEEQK